MMYNNPMQLFNMAKSMRNPNMFLNTMLKNNPQYTQAMNYINENGGDPKTAYYKLAEEKGVDPEQFLSQFK